MKKSYTHPDLSQLLKDYAIFQEDQQFKRGKRIIQQGKPFKGIYYVKDGLAKVCKKENGKPEFILWLARKGDILALDSYFNNEDYTASVVAMTDGKLGFVSRHEFRKLLQQQPHLIYDFINSLCHQANHLEERMLSLTQKKTQERLAETLLKITDTENSGVDVSSYHFSDLADILGTTDNYLYKILNTLDRKGLISFKNGLVKVLDRVKLKSLSMGDPVV